MGIIKNSLVVGGATFLIGALFMEIGDDENEDFDKTFPYIATFLSGAIGYYILRKFNLITFSAL